MESHSDEDFDEEEEDFIEEESAPTHYTPPPTITDLQAHAARRASRFVPEPEIGSGSDERRVYFNTKHKQVSFCDNSISTGKYTFLTFLPLFLFAQFRKAFNIFFLIISSLQQIPDVSPTGRYTTLLPLTFILIVAAIKEIVEDYTRHRQDDATNNRTCEVLHNGKFKKKVWTEIHTGDIVKVVKGHFFPADLVVINSSLPHGMCYIETANLDGETNLKIRQALLATSHLHTVEDFSKFTGHIECEGPNRHLYSFVGTLRVKEKVKLEKSYALCPDQILLRGAMLRNTLWVYGIVIYTGHESKLMQNASRAPLKMSNVDRTTNYQIWFLMIVLVIISLASVAGSYIWKADPGIRWYLDRGGLSAWDIFLEFLTFIILYNNLVPISLLVTLEVVKYIQAGFINCDLEMYYPITNTPAMARTSNLNEELGQVKYIFSDKTGTLTQNRMEFKKCCVAGMVFGEDEVDDFSDFHSPIFSLKLKEEGEDGDALRRFAVMMAICHTVVPEHGGDSSVDGMFAAIEYQSSSPDENAMVKAARNVGYVFTDRTPTDVTVNVLGHNERYEILNVLEFTSYRKCMSVIVRTPSGAIMLMCKGADSVIFERLSKNSKYADETERHLSEFAREGLRTLCFAYTFLDEYFYSKWNKEAFHSANIAVKNREILLADAYKLVERDLHLVGASAIEDRLQEGVPEAIATLIKADIKIWVLTGDKQETAINISYSCNLIDPKMLLIVIDEHIQQFVEKRMDEALAELGSELLRQEHEFALIVTGSALNHALHSTLEKKFLDLALSCKAVICCRVSPLQKAEIVELVKMKCEAITLAIGDGANDVSMIQAAHVGVGISGFEGLQAANSSDYSIAQFAYLQKLLLVHGAWNYSRLTKCILFSFYKNICLYLIELWFLFYNGFSGQILFDRWTITLYNLVFTSLPPFTLGLFERTCSTQTMLSYPQLYSLSQRAVKYNTKIFWQMFLNASIHSIFLFFLPVLAFSHEVVFENGKTGGYLFLGNFVYSYVVITVCLKSGLETSTWTTFTHVAIWGSVVAWFIVFFIYCNIFPMLGSFGADMVGQANLVLVCPLFWFGFVLLPITVLFRDLLWKVVRRKFHKTVVEEVQELEEGHLDPSSTIAAAQRRNPIRRRKFLDDNIQTVHTDSFFSIHEAMHGFAFSQDEGGAVSQCELIRQYDTTEGSSEEKVSVSAEKNIENPNEKIDDFAEKKFASTK